MCVPSLPLCLPPWMNNSLPTKANIALAMPDQKPTRKPKCFRIGEKQQEGGPQSRQSEIVKMVASRLFLLLGLGTLDLRCTAQSLLSVLALLACCGGEKSQYTASLQPRPWLVLLSRDRSSSDLCHGECRWGPMCTYVAVCWPSRSSWPGQHGPGGSGARTSSWPRGSRR